MKILVTGHKGFIGNALYKQLKSVADSHTIIGFDIKDFVNIDISLMFEDFLDKELPDMIFHVGANSDTQLMDVDRMMLENVHMSGIIAKYCYFYGDTDVVYSSSASCYGTDGLPNTLYGWTKYAAEEMLKPYGVGLRYFNVYGYDESHKGKMASVAYQSYIKHKLGREVTLFPSKPTRDFIYIKDVVSANMHMLGIAHLYRGSVYDVGTGVSRSFEDVLNIMNIPFRVLDPVEVEIPKTYQYYTCAKEMLPDWEAQYSLEEGLSDYLEILNK